MTQTRPNKALPQAHAETLWRLYRLTEPRHLQLEEFAMARGVLVHDGHLVSAEARLVRKGDRGIVRVRPDLRPETRRRFVIAHELGHWELHQKVSQIFLCTEGDMIADYRANPIEAEANAFASALLMPSRLFTSARAPGGPSFAELDRIGAVFNTSLTATAIRWMDLARDYCAFVVSRGGRVKWWRASEKFEESLWIRTGQPIPSRSLAARLDALQTRLDPEEVPIDVWADARDDLTTEVFVEESLMVPTRDEVFTLLWIP